MFKEYKQMLSSILNILLIQSSDIIKIKDAIDSLQNQINADADVDTKNNESFSLETNIYSERYKKPVIILIDQSVYNTGITPAFYSAPVHYSECSRVTKIDVQYDCAHQQFKDVYSSILEDDKSKVIALKINSNAFNVDMETLQLISLLKNNLYHIEFYFDKPNELFALYLRDCFGISNIYGIDCLYNLNKHWGL